MPTRLDDLKRASQVIDICTKEGLGYFIDLYGLKWHLDILNRWKLKKTAQPESLPQKIRKIMEQLGGAYIKLGQSLSLRPDLIPNEYCEEFKHLRDDIQPEPTYKIKQIIEQELQQPIKKIFTRFENMPIGSASIAQVHRAKTIDGKEIVIKVQRPEAEKQFTEDIDILYYLARKIEKHSKTIEKFKPLLIVQEFEKYTKKELDFNTEAKNIDTFYQYFTKNQTIKIPKVHHKYTTKKILTMEYLEGKKLSETKKLTTQQRKTIAYKLTDAATQQFFDLGTFHADMHPGNIILMQNNTLGLIDFGIIGQLKKELLQKIITTYIAVIQQDSTKAAQSLLEVAPPSQNTNVEQYKEDIAQVLDNWYGTSPKTTRYTQMLYLVLQVGLKHQLQFPKDLILFGKAAMTSEGTCTEIYPEFDYTAYSKPKIAQILRKQNAPIEIVKQFAQKTKTVIQNTIDLPETAITLMNRLQKEPIKIGIDNTDIRHLGFDINTSSNRLSYSMLIAALIIAGSLLINTGPSYKDYSIISMTTFFLAGIIIVPLLISVIHEGKKKYDMHNN